MALLVDVSDPQAPRFLGLLDGLGDVIAVAVAGDVAYLATEFGLVLVDVSDPTHPRRLGSVSMHPLGPRPVAVKVAGSLVYLAAEDRLLIVDAADRANPRGDVLSLVNAPPPLDSSISPRRAGFWRS